MQLLHLQSDMCLDMMTLLQLGCSLSLCSVVSLGHWMQ